MTPPAGRAPAPRLVYGPVPSRRFGYSLGIDLLPRKRCSFDCVYCQVGRTTRNTVRRRDFVPVAEVLRQVRAALRAGKAIDCVTLSGSGEPTLYRSLGPLIRGIKAISDRPVVVLTNGSLLDRPDVRRGLAGADIVVPTLDAADQATLDRVNRPNSALRLDRIVRGLKAFRREFRGRLWLEVMLVKGLNDGPGHLRRLKALIDDLGPDRVQLNTVVRPPADASAKPLSRAELERARRVLGPASEVVADVRKPDRRKAAPLRDEDILAVLRRRPATLRDLAASLGRPAAEIRSKLASLARAGRASLVAHQGRAYFEAR
jgi:wyosine [tRNA(Phe)-imidazoG37] synthetase (radical SAM superfamily)